MIRPSTSRLAVLACLLALPALAVQYEADIVIDSELDLYELQQDGQIDEDTLETLIELLRTGIDLNTASRDQLYVLPNVTYAEVDAIIAYREKVNGIRDPVELIQAGILGELQLVQLAPFLLRLEVGQASIGVQDGPISGRVRLVSAWSTQDLDAPPTAIQARAKGPFGFSAGLLGMTTRQRLGSLSYDPGAGALVAGVPGYGFQLPKAWARFENERFDVMLGTYRVGFGQRLTLDNTTRLTPDGFYADDALFMDADLDRACAEGTEDPETGLCSSADQTSYQTSDFSWRDGFRGVVATLKPTTLADGVSLSVTAFGSFQDRDVYQYHLVDRSLCSDPRDTSADCSAPPIYVRRPDGSASAERLTFATLPDVFQELAGGANATLLFGKSRLGLTGYGAMTLWPLNGEVQLDLQEFSRFPDGGPYGAIGLDGATAFGPVNLFLEVSRSFDSIAGRGGDWGALQRTVLAGKKEELELSLRYYGRDFDNPYARGISQADSLEGARARNEAGARLRYLNRVWNQVHVRGTVDAWLWPGDGTVVGTAGRANLQATGRVDYVGFKAIQPSVWLTHTNKDLAANNDRLACYDASTGDGTDIEDLCSGEAYRLGARVRVEPMKQLTVILQYNHALYDTGSYDTAFMQDVRALADVVVRPLPELRLRARARWLEDDLIDELGELRSDRGEGSLWSTLDATYAVQKSWRARLRYDNYWWLDQRDSTLLRTPNPEHRLRAELEVIF